MALGTTVFPSANIPVSTAYPRQISYSGAAGNGIILDLCNYTVSTREVESARGVLKRIYRFSFQFVISTDGMTNYTDVITRVERVLNERAGILIIQDAGKEIYKCGPAQTVTLSNAPVVNVDHTVRPTLLADIEWGPNPVSLNIQPIGVGGYGQWVVDVTTASEDAFVIGDSTVIGVNAEVTYAIDKQHYTTRTVTGKVYIANWGRTASNPFGKAAISEADIAALRRALLGTTQLGYTKGFMDPILIPPGFCRVAQTFNVDQTENALGFVITDRENYRLYPNYITDAACQVTCTIDSASQVAYVRHVLTGYCEAPHDVDKGRVLKACFEQIEDAMGPLLFRQSNNLKAFVYSATFTNDAYSNKIAYQLLILTPYGDFNAFNSLGIATFRSAAFLPQGIAGSAGLFGSAYRQNTQGGYRTTTSGAGELPGGVPQEGSATPATGPVAEAGNQGEQASRFPYTEASPSILVHNLKSEVVEHTEQTVAMPSTVGVAPVPYSRTEPIYKIKVEAMVVAISENVNDPTEYLARVKIVTNAIPGLTLLKARVKFGDVLTSPLGSSKVSKYTLDLTFQISGALHQRINKAGGIDVFITTLEAALLAQPNTAILDSLQKFITAGQNGSLFP